MTEIKLTLEDHDIEDLIRYLDGDHHMSLFDRLQVIKDLRAQLPKPKAARYRLAWQSARRRASWLRNDLKLAESGEQLNTDLLARWTQATVKLAAIEKLLDE